MFTIFLKFLFETSNRKIQRYFIVIKKGSMYLMSYTLLNTKSKKFIKIIQIGKYVLSTKKLFKFKKTNMKITLVRCNFRRLRLQFQIYGDFEQHFIVNSKKNQHRLKYNKRRIL